MWVSYENIWLFYVGGLGLILFLYLAKAVVLRYVRESAFALVAFVYLAALCVPIAWALSPDWKNRSILPIANYVGTPIIIMTVPCLSFLIDLSRRPKDTAKEWYWRIPLEVVVFVPLWFYFWVFFEVVLGWVWF
ncbi:MAG: hypothetical protein QM703_14740 [Gemmatales bacterium]